ncbi:MAG: hypothetical protein K9M15_00075 [Candidatus Marinimicrobia bacterium]|nr:hypothetical protein [Candidatus Neomarinimicrobiota bacterium]
MAKTTKILILSVFILIALRLIFVFFVIPNLASLEQFKHNDYFSMAINGDDTGYYELAEMVYKFDFKMHEWTFGYPIVMSLFIFIFGEGFYNIAFPVVFSNGVLLFSVSMALVVGLSFLIFRKILPAIISGVSFLLFPFLFYLFRNFGPSFPTGNWNDFNFFHFNWLTAMSDSFSAFLSCLILFLFVFSLLKNKGFFYFSLLGFLSGYAMMVRISNIVIPFTISLVILIYCRDKIKKLFFFTAFALVGFLPQFIYNFVFFGSPISFGYEGAYDDWVELGFAHGPKFGISNVFHLVSKAVEYSFWVVPFFVLLVSVLAIGYLGIRKISKPFALAMILWFLLPVLFYMSFVTGTSTMRYYMPAVAPGIILGTGAYFWLFGKIKKISQS